MHYARRNELKQLDDGIGDTFALGGARSAFSPEKCFQYEAHTVTVMNRYQGPIALSREEGQDRRVE